jgi:hypothetical protein
MHNKLVPGKYVIQDGFDHNQKKALLSKGHFQLLSQGVYSLILSFLESQG